MSPTLLLSVALTVPAAPIPRDADNAASPAPRVIAVKADGAGAVRINGYIPTKVTVSTTQFVIETVVENGKQVQKQVQKQIEYDTVTTQYFNKTLADFGGKFTTAEGTALTVDEATARVRGGATLLASSDGKPVSKSWLRTVAPDTVVMIADGLSHAQLYGSSTAPPRLARLATDANGTLVAACVGVVQNNNYYYDDLAFEGRGGRVRFRNFDDGTGNYYGNNPTPAPVANKPLTDVAFDAFDVTGKRVNKSEALKRLAAGGTILVAGDNRMPDETFLKAFKDDVLILIGQELILPIVPVDQTTKKKAEEKPMAAPVAPIAPMIAPAVRPAIAVGNVKIAAAAVEAKKIEAQKAEEKKAEDKKAEEEAEKKKAEEKQREKK